MAPWEPLQKVEPRSGVCSRPAPFRGLSPPEARRILSLGRKSAQVNYGVLLND